MHIIYFLLLLHHFRRWIFPEYADPELFDLGTNLCVIILGVKKNFCYFSSLITFYYIHESIMRKGKHFLITNANSFHWLQAPQKMSQIWMNTLLSWIHAVQTLWGFEIVHSWWNVAKSETIFWKECMITEQWKRVMLHNQTHKIVHSSAMYYQTLIIIHECSKKLLKMKYSKSCF